MDSRFRGTQLNNFLQSLKHALKNWKRSFRVLKQILPRWVAFLTPQREHSKWDEFFGPTPSVTRRRVATVMIGDRSSSLNWSWNRANLHRTGGVFLKAPRIFS